MKLAVMSDIHSNAIALEECISYIERNPVDGIVLLGDYVSDCPDPQLTLEKIRMLMKQYPVYAIRGNREEYFLNYRDDPDLNWNRSSYQGSLLYTYERLKKEDLDWFEGLKNHHILKLDGVPSICLAHGSPGYSKELMEAEADNTKDWLLRADEDYILAGHTHKQTVYRYKGKTLFNPGSVGVAIGALSCAHMAYMTGSESGWSCEFISLPYSMEKVEKWFHTSSLENMANIWPKCILASMKNGCNMGPQCAKRAYDLAVLNHEVNIEGQGGRAPEPYWEMAARELGII